MADVQANLIIKGDTSSATSELQKLNQQLESSDLVIHRMNDSLSKAAEIKLPTSKFVPVDSEAVKETESMAQFMGQVATATDGSTESLKANNEQMEALKDALKEIAPGLGRFGDLAAIGEGAIGAGAIVGLADFAKEAVVAADELQAVDNRAKVVYGEDFPEMSAKADELAASLHRSSDNMLGFSTQTTAITEGLGISKQAAEQMSVGLDTLAVNIGKVFHSSDADAMNALQMALEGNTRGLREYGIVLNDTILQDYAQSQGIRAKIADMDAEQKAILEYNYLMSSTSDINNAASTQTGSLDDSIKQLQASFHDLMQEVGGPLLTGATTGIQALTAAVDALPAAMSAVQHSIEDIIPGLSAVLSLAQDAAAIYEKIAGHKSTGDGLTPFFSGTIGDASQKTAFDAFGVDLNHTASGANSAAKQLEQLQQTLTDLGNTYDNVSQSVQDKLLQLETTHEDKVQTIQDKIASLTASLADLKSTYEDTMQSTTTSMEDAFNKQSNSITSLKQKLADLQLRAYQENEKGSISVQTNTDIERTQAEIDKQTKSFQEMQKYMTTQELADASTRDGMTPELKEWTDLQNKRAEATLKYNESVAKTKDQIATEQSALATENAAFVTQRGSLLQTQSALQDFHAAWVSAMNDIGQVTKDQVNQMKQELTDLNRTMSSAQAKAIAESSASTNIPARASGGPAGGLTLVGEQGPELVNLPQGSTVYSNSDTMKMMQQPAPIVIHVTIGTVTKEADVDMVMQALARKIQLQRLSSV